MALSLPSLFFLPAIGRMLFVLFNGWGWVYGVWSNPSTSPFTDTPDFLLPSFIVLIGSLDGMDALERVLLDKL